MTRCLNCARPLVGHHRAACYGLCPACYAWLGKRGTPRLLRRILDAWWDSVYAELDARYADRTAVG